MKVSAQKLLTLNSQSSNLEEAFYRCKHDFKDQSKAERYQSKTEIRCQRPTSITCTNSWLINSSLLRLSTLVVICTVSSPITLTEVNYTRGVYKYALEHTYNNIIIIVADFDVVTSAVTPRVIDLNVVHHHNELYSFCIYKQNTLREQTILLITALLLSSSSPS